MVVRVLQVVGTMAAVAAMLALVAGPHWDRPAPSPTVAALATLRVVTLTITTAAAGLLPVVVLQPAVRVQLHPWASVYAAVTALAASNLVVLSTHHVFDGHLEPVLLMAGAHAAGSIALLMLPDRPVGTVEPIPHNVARKGTWWLTHPPSCCVGTHTLALFGAPVLLAFALNVVLAVVADGPAARMGTYQLAARERPHLYEL
jgi:hypothetical protein